MLTPTPTPTPIDAWLRAATLPHLAAVALALAAYPVLAGAQVRHWATSRPLGDGGAGSSLWTALRRRSDVAALFRGRQSMHRRLTPAAAPLALHALLTLGACVLTAAASAPPRPTERGVALQIALVLATFIAAWTATSPLAALHAARELGARPSVEGVRAAFLAGAVHAALLASALLQLLLAPAFGSGPGWELAPYAAACELASWPLRVGSVRIVAGVAANGGEGGMPRYAGGLWATCRRICEEEGWGVLLGW